MKFRPRLFVLTTMLLCMTPLITFAQKSVPVTVTNTKTNPVPTVATGTTTVSGSVAINGTPTVIIGAMPAVSGTVGISGTPTVALSAGSTVALSPLTTINSADTAARSIVRLQAAMQGTAGAPSSVAYPDVPGGTNATGYAPPSGKRLVINLVTILMASQNSPATGFQPSAIISFFVPVSGGYQLMVIPMTLQQQPNGTFIGTPPVPIYVDAGSNVILEAGANQNWTGSAFLQGYLVDCGAGCTQ